MSEKFIPLQSAFPIQDREIPGLSKIEYAAIHLKVPCGTNWLDEMIQKSRRDEFDKVTAAAQFLNKNAWKDADALIKASDEVVGEK